MQPWPPQFSAVSNTDLGRAISQAVNRQLPNSGAIFGLRSGHVEFVVDRVALGQVFS
jgi:hypothetical protein